MIYNPRPLTRSPAHPLTRSLVWVGLGLLVLALALLPLRMIVLAAGLSLVLVLPVLVPVFGLYWAILSIPIQELVHLPGGLSYTQAAMLLAVLGWGLRVLAHPERPVITNRLVLLWAALLWVLLLSTSFTPYLRIEGIKETLRWAEAFLIWLITINTVQRRWQIIGLIACLLLAPAADAAIGLAQFLTGDGPASYRIAPGSPFVRAYGTIGAPNSFAGYLNMTWPLALALAVGATVALWRGRKTGDQQHTAFVLRPTSLVAWSVVGGLWSVVGLLLAALVASFSRGGWVGAAIGALGMAAALGRRAAYLTAGLVAIGVLALALGGANLLPAPLGSRLASIVSSLEFFDPSTVTVTPENFAKVERMAQLQAGWRMFLAHPLTGVGPGNYTPAFPDFTAPPWYASRGHAHNYYLHVAGETGIFGLLAYLALLGGVIYQALVTLRRTNRTVWHSAAIGCCGIIAAVAGHNLFENLHVLSMGIQIAAAWGLLSVIDTTERVKG